MTDGKGMLSLMSGRQSERKYLDKPVEKEKIERITRSRQAVTIGLQRSAMEVHRCG